MLQKVLRGDSLSLLDEIEDASVKLLLTSPPYNLGKEYEKAVSLDSYVEYMNNFINNLLHKLAGDAVVCWQVGNMIFKGEVIPLDMVFYPIFKSAGLYLINRVVWHYGHGLHASKRLSGRYETILCFAKSREYTFNLDDIRVPSKYPQKKYFKGPKKGELSGNPLGKNPSDVWEITNVKNNHPEKTAHPCQFPLLLAERCIKAFTNPGDLVFDPFAGAGTTGVAAKNTGRDFVLIEKEEKYIQIINDRLNQ